MHALRISLVLISVLGCSFSASRALAEPDKPLGQMSADDLILLEQTVQAQYQNSETKFETKLLHTSPDASKTTLEMSRKVFLRWQKTPQRSLAQETISEPSVDGDIQKIFVAAPTWSKRFIRMPYSPDWPDAPGEADMALGRAYRPGGHVLGTLWPDFIWNGIDSRICTCSVGSVPQTLVLESVDRLSHIRDKVIVDAAHGFLPILSERARPNGKVVFRYAFSDLRKTDKGLWFPFSCKWGLVGVDEIVVTVKEVHLNEPLKPADFDMPFPADAYVTDNISGRRYTLSDRATPSSDSATIDNDGIILTPQDLVPTPPATHHQLNNAAKPSR